MWKITRTGEGGSLYILPFEIFDPTPHFIVGRRAFICQTPSVDPRASSLASARSGGAARRAKRHSFTHGTGALPVGLRRAQVLGPCSCFAALSARASVLRAYPPGALILAPPQRACRAPPGALPLGALSIGASLTESWLPQMARPWALRSTLSWMQGRASLAKWERGHAPCRARAAPVRQRCCPR